MPTAQSPPRPGSGSWRDAEPFPVVTGTALPNLVVIGAMKAGTSALHTLLGLHPDVCMASPKELNFFYGDEVPGSGDDWHRGNWHRGVEWYAGHFDPASRVRGESSPGYTSPNHPEVPARMARIVPDARLVFLVRDPVERAVSQYVHHRRERSERRDIAEALLDPASQYVARGRYHERLVPFLDHYDRSRVLVVAQEELSTRGEEVLGAVAEFVDVDVTCAGWGAVVARWQPTAPRAPTLEASLLRCLQERFRDDADGLRAACGREFPGWCV